MIFYKLPMILAFVLISAIASYGKIPGYYVTNTNDTVKTNFSVSFENGLIYHGFSDGILTSLNNEKKIIWPKDVKEVSLMLNDRVVRLITRSDIVRTYREESKKILGSFTTKDISPSDTLHRKYLFTQVIDSSGPMTISWVDYRYENIKQGGLILRKNNGQPFYVIGKISMNNKEFINYMGNCPSINSAMQDVFNHPNQFKTKTEILVEIVKKYNELCASNKN